ncbi:MAG: pyridoxal phosphate-dependent aminotransferase [Alkalibacterium sp.]|nr:pyridoxal phosphate-dependent aminotransferase [Alkalibacterium sp.]
MTFDKIINRTNTGSVKWDKISELFGDKDLLPMWIADMDFENAPPIKKALRHMISEEIMGYTFPKDSLYSAIINWQDTHHHMKVDKEHIQFSPGVLSSIGVIIQALTDPGDGILIHDPVYTPFAAMADRNNRTVHRSKLIIEEGQYIMDFDDIETTIKNPKVKLFILSNPHNPGGRVWNRNELSTLVELCIKHEVILISDEIHSDLVYPGYQSISPVTLKESYKQWVITLHSASKTFNVAGAKLSFIIVFDERLFKKIEDVLQLTELDAVNSFGMCATEAAFSESEEWRHELLAYLELNRQTIMAFFDDHLPYVSYMTPESTYLFWFDASPLNIEPDKLREFFVEKGKIALNDGISYGPNGQAYMRMNFAVPHSVLIDGLNRVKTVFDSSVN